MKFLIQNTTANDKFIVRFTGETLCIPKYDFIQFDSDDAVECNYWSRLTPDVTSGICVITNPSRIQLFNKLKACGKYNNKCSTIEPTNTTINSVEVETTSKTEVAVEPEQLTTSVEELDIPVDVVETPNTVEDFVEVPTEETATVETKEVVEEITDTEEVNTSNVVDVTEDTTTENTVEAVDTSITYTEEELSNMSKEELQGILNSLGIEYRKNSSVSKLINLILENN